MQKKLLTIRGIVRTLIFVSLTCGLVGIFSGCQERSNADTLSQKIDELVAAKNRQIENAYKDGYMQGRLDELTRCVKAFKTGTLANTDYKKEKLAQTEKYLATIGLKMSN
jgi:hypothetical protein